jgi:hypothetical protein
MRLPTNPRIKQQIMELGEGWSSLIDASSTHKLLYSLIIVQELIEKQVGWV